MKAFVSLLSYVRRSLWRARTRSLLTVLGTAFALGIFTFVQALESGVTRLGDEGDSPLLVVFQQSRFCPMTSTLPVRYAEEVRGMEGVEAVLPSLVFVNACRANLDLVTLQGVPAEDLTRMFDLRWRGAPGDLSGRGDGALIGARLAERRGLEVGQRVRLANVDVVVAGIFEADVAGFDNSAFVNEAQLQNARDLQGRTTQLLVRVAGDADPERVAAAIDARFASDEKPTDTKTMQAFVAGAISEIGEIVDFARLLGYLAVIVVVLVLGNTVFISAESRAQEFATMEVVGVTRPLLAALLSVESLVLALVGGALGVGAVALVLTLTPLTIGVEGWGIDVAVGSEAFLLGGVVSLAVGLVAALGPALGVLRRDLPRALAVN